VDYIHDKLNNDIFDSTKYKITCSEKDTLIFNSLFIYIFKPDFYKRIDINKLKDLYSNLSFL
jgi:hypothetical protein